jgi:DNA-binding transcriptional MerR regulator
MATDAALLTIDQLADSLAKALEIAAIEPTSGRVRTLPDVRTLRYYTTLGLLDKPTRMEGRTAYYSRRHLLQLVGIKRLQAQGQSLAEIQARLLNASDDDLAQLAALPANFEIQAPPEAQIKRSTNQTSLELQSPALRVRREPAGVFWKARPAPAAMPVAAPAPPAHQAASAAAVPDSLLVGVPLGTATSLVFPALRAVDEQDLEAIRSAAQPLLDELRARRLLP